MQGHSKSITSIDRILGPVQLHDYGASYLTVTLHFRILPISAAHPGIKGIRGAFMHAVWGKAKRGSSSLRTKVNITIRDWDFSFLTHLPFEKM